MEQGKVSVHIFRIITCGEPLGANQRHYMEKTFQAEVVLKEPEDDSRCPFTRAVGLLGRNEDNKNGNREFLHPLAVEGICIEGLRDYQFRQVGMDAFEMFAEIADRNREEEIHSEILTQMRRILMEKGLGYVQFDVCFVKEILPDRQTGKKRLVLPMGMNEWRRLG